MPHKPKRRPFDLIGYIPAYGVVDDPPPRVLTAKAGKVAGARGLP